VIGARPAVAADAAAIAELRAAARSQTLDKRGGPHFSVSEGAAPAVLLDADADEAAVIVGLIHETPVGIATLERRGARALLSEFYTHQEARGVGVGHAMLESVIARARDWNCTDLDSYALPGDRDTKNFFESHAMKSRLLIVHRSLSDE